MNVNIGKNNINFGWSCETHKTIMDTALKDFPEFNEYKDTFNYYVQRPDHDDIGFMANKHFFFGDNQDTVELSTKNPPSQEKPVSTATSNGLTNIFKKIFSSEGTSFMDYNGQNNAKSAYNSQVDGVYYAVEEGDSRWAIESAARAAHYLQDMTQPQHIERTSLLGKATDLKIHNDFENKIDSNNQIMPEKYETENPPEENNINNKNKIRNFTELFQDTFKSTQDLGKITRENQNNWDEIGQNQFNLAVNSTKELLKNLSQMMGLS